MAIFQLALLAGLAISPGSDSAFDCGATAHRFAEMSREMRASTELDEKDEIGRELSRMVSELYPRRRACLVSEVLPILTDLVDDPNAETAFVVSGALAELAVDAKPALPALRRAAERAKLADDARVAQLMAESPGRVIITGAGLEDGIRVVIDAIEDAQDSTAAWEDGLCYRVERRIPADFQFRVVANPSDSASCTDERFEQSPSWTYGGPYGAEKYTASPANLLIAWSGLSKLLEQRVRISQICSASTREHFSIDPILAESNLQFVYEEDDPQTFGAAFDFRDEARKRIVYVGFEFQDAREIGVKDLRAIECGSRPAH